LAAESSDRIWISRDATRPRHSTGDRRVFYRRASHRVGVRLFIAALAFALVVDIRLWSSTGVPEAVCAMALISTIYTLLGGLKAVVWTDVAQGSIFFIGAASALLFGLGNIETPLSVMVGEAFDAGKTTIIQLEPWPLATDGRGNRRRPFGRV
jgi:Na+/proline symporter